MQKSQGNFADVIKRIRDDEGLSQRSLANKLKIHVNTVSLWERGLSVPDDEMLEKIAKTFGMPYYMLLAKVEPKKWQAIENDFKDNPDQLKLLMSNWQLAIDHTDSNLIPVLGIASCGQWDEFNNLAFPREHAEDWKAAPTNDPDAFYVIAKGESMIGDGIRDGDLLLVEPNAQITNGCKVLARCLNNGCTVKRFYREDGRIRLQPMNPDFAPIYPEENEEFRVYRITGKFSKL